ncbi:MAG: MerR family transcriptional regulator [Defluviitaleaceae bacterium]|nr:MerR family transcriptional regulator [Defluviitaleaceae bacterium]
MEKYKAIPEGYMRIGILAKKADVSVRTLQYYDKEGLLSPSSQSEGGFRLYNENDMAKLAQIMLLKELGLPLSEIKKRLSSLETKDDAINMLTDHAAHIRSKVDVLLESLEAIEALKGEITQMETVDIQKYFAILMNLQIKNKNYWMVKHFDNDILQTLSESMNREDAIMLVERTNRIYEVAARLREEGVSPGSDEGQALAKEFWEIMMGITGGDMELLQKINSHAEKSLMTDDVNFKKFMETSSYIQPALEIYLANLYEGDE